MVSRSFAVSLMLAAIALQVQCISLKREGQEPEDPTPASGLGMIELHSSSEQYFDMIAVSEDSHVCLYGKKPAFQAVMKKDNRDALARMKDAFAADDMKFQIEKTCHEYYGLEEEIPFKEWKGEATETPMCVDLKKKGYLGLSMCFNSQEAIKAYISKNEGRIKNYAGQMPPIPQNPF